MCMDSARESTTTFPPHHNVWSTSAENSKQTKSCSVWFSRLSLAGRRERSSTTCWTTSPLEENSAFCNYLTSGTLLMYGRRIVIPPSLREDILNRLHNDGHFGLNKCRQRAAESVWWPRIGIDLKRHLENCSFCQVHAPAQHSEPLVTTPTPSRPWTHVAADVFHFNNCNWLVTVDLFSRYLEIQRLPSLTSSAVIERLKRLFSRLGIPDLVTTDGGTQFTSSLFTDFTSSYGFTHRVTDPHTPSSNGAAERAVRTAKWILRQKDPHLALLN